MFHVPEINRFSGEHSLSTSTFDGNNGLFLIKNGSDYFQCIASDGLGWEHVSVTIRTKNRQVYSTPNWEEMCLIKNLFWDENDTVIQYHPAKSEYVNNHPFVLHLWRPTEEKLPIPNSLLVGIK